MKEILRKYKIAPTHYVSLFGRFPTTQTLNFFFFNLFWFSKGFYFLRVSYFVCVFWFGVGWVFFGVGLVFLGWVGFLFC